MRERIIKPVSINKDEIIKFIMYTIGGILMGGSKVAGVFSPFSVAFCMAVPIEYTIFSFLGASVGVIVLGGTNNIIYLAAILLSSTIKYMLRVKSPIINSLLAGISLQTIYILTMIISPLGFASVIMTIAESMLTTSMTFLFAAGLRGIKKTEKNAAEMSGLAIISIALILSSSQIELFEFNLGVIITGFLTIQAAILYGSAGGSILGLLSTVALCLYTKDFALIGGVIAVSGFVSGVFRPLGKVSQSFMFVGVYLLSSAFVGGLSIQGLIEVSLAALIAFIIPLKTFDRLMIKRDIKIKEAPHLSDDLSLKLEFTARTLLDLQDNVEECATKLDEYTATNLNKIYNQTTEKVCKDCGLKKFCWATNYETTTRSVSEITKTLKEQGNINLNNIPEFFKQKCCKIEDFIMSINTRYREYLSKEQASRRIAEVREVATEQFSSMSTLLMEMSDELNDHLKRDVKVEEIVEDIFDNKRLDIKRVSCLIDRFGRMTIDVYMANRVIRKTLISITQTISNTLDREFELPSITEANGEYKISFFEEAVYKVDFSGTSFSKEGDNCCGDSFDYFIDSKGFEHIILSDGMGSGKRAAIDSVMTCSTLKKLIQNGFGFDSAFKLINLSFAVKSNDESLATIDVTTIDLYTGDTRIIKAGAATSFVKRKNEVIAFNATTLPIGIIQGVPYDCEEIKLSKGDLVVMVSDGALVSGEEWVAEELKIHSNKTAKEISKILLESAKRRIIDDHEDDITVIVAKII